MTAAITASASLVALFVSGLFGALAIRRAAYERVLRALDFVSDGPVARSRHRLGTVVYEHDVELRDGNAILTAPHDRDQRATLIEDLFVILWAARRIEATRRSLGRWDWVALGPADLLKESVAKWVEWWVQKPLNGNDRMRIELVAACLGASVSRDDDLDGLITLRDRWLDS